jgi:4'-phosphopantetheinyl transferase
VTTDMAADSRSVSSTPCSDLECVSARTTHTHVSVTPSLAEGSLVRAIAPFTWAFSALLSEDAVEVIATNLDPAAKGITALAELLSDSERERARRFVYERDRRRFIVGRGRLRELLAERLGVLPKSLEFTYGAHGKPALAPRFADSNLRFNVSHSQDLALYAVAVGREVGIDVEAVRRLPDADEIAERFFSPHENEAYRALDPWDRPLGFFNCWTRKEAFVKALGEGLSHPLHSFEVTLGPRQAARFLRIGNALGSNCGWRVRGFCPATGFVAAVVSELI